MRRFATLGAGLALLFSGAVVVAAASPSPSPTTTAPNTSAATEPTFTAQVQPLQVSGSATVAELSGGEGTVTLKLTGLLSERRWTVDIDAGTIARPNERVEIASRAGDEVTRMGTDTVRIHLTRTEMAAFLRARKAGGAVAIVSDGARVGYAAFSTT